MRSKNALALRLTETAETAEADLAEIWADIANKASESIATRFLSEVEASFEPIRCFPLATSARGQLTPGLRGMFHGPYAIYYQPLADEVVIIRVLHGARDVAAIAAQRGFAS